MLLQLVLEGTPEEIVANYIVSIPQAVGVVATWLSEKQKLDASVGFQYRER